MKVYYRIEVFNKVSGEYSGDFTYNTTPDVIIDDVIAFDYDNSIESNSDKMMFRIENSKKPDGTYKYKEKLQVDDRVIIYLTSIEEITATNKNTYIRWDGFITDMSYDVSENGRVISCQGLNRFDKILNFVFPAVYNQADYPDGASSIIQNLLDNVNDDNSNYQVTWATGNSATTTPIQFNRTYRPVSEMIAELSTQKINKEFNAMYYINSDNELIWIQKSTDTDTMVLEEGVDFNNLKIREKVWEVINAIITDCGQDPSGRSIHALYYDEQSAAEFGLKWAPTIEVETEIASNLIAEQQALDGWVENGDLNKAGFPGSYPLELTFEGRDNDGTFTGSLITVTGDASWVSAIRTEAKWQGIAWMKSVLDLTGHVRPKLDIVMRGTTWERGANRTGTNTENCLDSDGDPIRVGDRIKVKVASWGNNNGNDWETGMDLRVVQVNQEVNKGGWITTVRVEQDIDDFNP